MKSLVSFDVPMKILSKLEVTSLASG